MADREKRTRRRWSVEEKQRIVAEVKMPGSSVSEVSRRYDVNANMIFKWIADPRFNQPAEMETDEPAFLPVEVGMSLSPEPEAEKPCQTPGRIEIRLANGHGLALSGAVDVDVVVRLARGLCP